MISPEFQAKLESTYAHLRSQAAINARGYDWRISQLKALRALITENEDAICKALHTDFHKPRQETISTETGIVISEIDFALKHLKKWMKPKKLMAPIYNQPGRCEVRRDSLGLVLVIGAWNYPINLLLCPVVAAITGGNSVLMKPSELDDATAALISQLIPKYMDQKSFAVLQGGAEETTAILAKQYDYIFFTGSGKVGKIVMEAAAAHLTPVTLELGGKSPAVVLADADLEMAGKRIAWGKFMNGGQTCVAPDYVLVPKAAKTKLVASIVKHLEIFYGPDPKVSPDYCRIINDSNFKRLASFLPGAKILHGGQTVEADRYMAPTVIEATWQDKVMQEEIFGPILPIVEMEDPNAMIEEINRHPHPLAFYIFTSSREMENRFLTRTTSGGACVNDVVMHMPVATMPFGGVGASGMGQYHGLYGYETFTHPKAILKRSTWLDMPLRYPPYSDFKARWIKRFL